LFIRTAWRHDLPYCGTPLDPEDMTSAAAAIVARDDYQPTPLRSLPGLARALRLGAVSVKDEACRFGLGGIKALGAPYGLEYLLARQENSPATYTAVAATDGNHGLALAWAAARAGCRARIYVGTAVNQMRIDRIQATGAAVEVVDGTYDAAVAAAARAAREPGVLLVTDTDHVGGLPVTRAIMAGYSLLAREVAQQANIAEFTHVFLQCGVGGVAAGIAAGLWQRLGRVPRLVTVEPVRAACVLASLEAGRLMQVTGTLETRMVGLACGLASLPAWEILSQAVFAAMTVGEDDARLTQVALAQGIDGDPPLSSGDTGIAGLAGLCVAAADAQARARLGLDTESRILLVSSEGRLHGTF
jgi:diaminopropionate ammonia-lyase